MQLLHNSNDGDGAWRQRRRCPDKQWPPPRHACALWPGIHAPRAVVLWVQVRRPPPHRSRDGFTYARPLSPLDVHDLDRAPGHVSKFNSLSYLVRRSLLNPPGGRVNKDRWRNCDGHCNDDGFYGNDGGGGDDGDEGEGGR